MFYISSKRGNRYGITDTRDNVEEFYNQEQINQISKKIKIYGVSYKGITVVTYTMFKSYEDLIDYFVRYMERRGICILYSDRRIENIGDSLYYSVRFIMGEDAWYSSANNDDEDSYCEDLCDADRLKRSASKKLQEMCNEFYKDTGIYPSWQTGEKAWCYFEFL